MRSETDYRSDLVDEIKRRFPGCITHRLDAAQQQGIPDLLILFEDRWAALEIKKSATARVRPNQPYWVDKMNSMSFSAFIYPENEDEVLDALEQSFGLVGSARHP